MNMFHKGKYSLLI